MTPQVVCYSTVVVTDIASLGVSKQVAATALLQQSL